MHYSKPTYPRPQPRQPYGQKLGNKPLLLASFAMVFASLLVDFKNLPGGLMASTSGENDSDCSQVISDTSRLSRAQLAQLLTIPERDTKEKVRQVVSEPFCQLPTLNVRSGVAAEREAYPLAFDPGTTLVILYENNEYAGYRFSFN